MSEIEIGMILSLTIWIGLLLFWGKFWLADQQLEETETKLKEFPAVCAVIPARNEADLLPITMRSLLLQDYPGSFSVLLVDDHSTDGTAQVALDTAQTLKKDQQLHILTAQPLPSGWTGKLWAINQGIHAVETLHATSLQPQPVASLQPQPVASLQPQPVASLQPQPVASLQQTPEYFLLTDADIEHDIGNLRRLVAKAVQEDLDLVSVMVRLRCESFWEKLLIPAFVFFFQKLYPFPWVNNPNNKTAAAAGGCILIRREALTRIGGIQVVRQALIDDCALAEAVKKSKGRIWLGFSSRDVACNVSTRSLRPYPSLGTIWDMVARTAYTQLNYSPLLLLGTLFGMTLIYLVPPVGAIAGTLTGNWLIAATGLSAWLLMTLAYFPTIRFYKCSPWLAFCLPAIALLYTLMTLDSALRHWQGRGGAWKGRVYSG